MKYNFYFHNIMNVYVLKTLDNKKSHVYFYDHNKVHKFNYVQLTMHNFNFNKSTLNCIFLTNAQKQNLWCLLQFTKDHGLLYTDLFS